MNGQPSSKAIDTATREAAEWFARLRADDVSGQDRARFESWLAADPRHRSAYAGFERFWSTTGSYASDRGVAAATRAAVVDAAAEAATRVPPQRQAPAQRRRWLAIAASVCVFLLSAALLALWPGDGQVYETALGEQRSVALPDGSRVTLNTDTRIRVAYTGEARRVRLEHGQAYFRVAKEHRPFDVETQGRIVRAVGTAFDVYQNRGEVIVTVVEGTVLVTDPGTALPPARGKLQAASGGRLLQASQRLALAGGSPLLTAAVETAPLERSVAWLSGKLVFDDEALPAALAEINRYSRRQVLLGDAALKTLQVSGVFRVGEPGEFVESVSRYFALHVEPDADGNYVLYAPPAGAAARKGG